jgi:hypothetical protein
LSIAELTFPESTRINVFGGIAAVAVLVPLGSLIILHKVLSERGAFVVHKK